MAVKFQRLFVSFLYSTKNKACLLHETGFVSGQALQENIIVMSEFQLFKSFFC